ncbi:squalene/phytoene synthase family protein [Streptomyces sp. RFCAC02]|uniref:squalene/phytoene synthase family protein n=1 Tax=Streptomyces sp. RFCAC02 TaxID=2499143 RepID=UPI001020BF1B|nr:squalene/phytoene synthase family protein [Streptomyces sp. RFCAC02]
MSARELDLAGIREPLLRAAFTRCETILRTDDHAAHSWLRNRLRPAVRPYWDAMIAFCGHADDLADAPGVAPATRRRRYDAFAASFFRVLAAGDTALAGPDDGDDTGAGRLVSLAFAHFARTWRLDEAGIREASRALRADMDRSAYPTLRELETYMHGVSGQPSRWLAVLLEPDGRPPSRAAQHAAVSWGFGLQTLDFVLDVEEDTRVGKVYFPLDDLSACGLGRDDLVRAVAARRATGPLRRVVGAQVDRARAYFATAGRWLADGDRPGWAPVRASLAEGLRTADHIERCNYDIFRATTSRDT